MLYLSVVNLLLSTAWLFRGEINYDLDIARDFLVLREAIISKRPFLIGPHSGIIGGVFHGPLWYYLNLPAFIASGGNPIAMGWFWWGLSILTLVIVGWVALKLFGKKVAVWSVFLYSLNSIINPVESLKQFFNPYGAVMASPLFFYFLLKYFQNSKGKDLVVTILLIGLLIQFQMAFGFPILLVSILLILTAVIRNKNYRHLWNFLILLLPLSTFILFDLRHDFLQLRSVWSFLISGQKSVALLPFLLQRLKSIFSDVYLMLAPRNIILAWVYSLAFLVICIKKNLFRAKTYMLFFHLYFGYWTAMFIFKGWTGNYFWPFLPIVVILLASLSKKMSRKYFVLFIGPLILCNYYVAILRIATYPNREIDKRGINSWAYNQEIAKYIFEDANNDFGYFIFTPDRWVFNQKYALEYEGKFYPTKQPFASVKKPLTYLVIVDPPVDRPDIDPVGWRISDLGINKDSVNSKRIDVITIYKYKLTDTDIAVPQNPNLLDSTFFR